MRGLTFAVIGHVDHGKTALTRALTGVDTDRLAEEKRRGLTIEPGFAPLRLEQAVVGLVDDPGHEKFLPNLLAASNGVDALLLVVAAEEGPMPQTWEHLEVLTCLGVTRGLAVLTKTDLLPQEEVRARADALTLSLRGSILEGEPVCPVSARTGAGLGELRKALEQLARRCPPREESRPFRLPVDRAFPVDGFGPVVTGTVLDGTLRAGESLRLWPGEKEVKVRGIQRHGQPVERVFAGERAALNLSGVEVGELRRGMVAAAPGSLCLTRRLDAFVTVWEKSPRPLTAGTALRLYCGSGAVIGRSFPLEGTTIFPGDGGYVQLRLEEETALRPLDRFVLRFLTPAATAGGGTALDLEPVRHRRGEGCADLEELRAGGLPALVRRLLRRAEGPLDTETVAARLGVSPSEAGCILSQLPDVRPAGNLWIGEEKLDWLRETTHQALAAFHTTHPLASGMGREELRHILPDEVAELLAGEGVLRLSGPTAALTGFVPVWPDQLLPFRERLAVLYDGFGLAPPENSAVEARFGRDLALARQAGRRMEEEGELILYAPRRRIARRACEGAEARLRQLFARQERVTLAQFRDAAGISRDAALRLLEYWDKTGLTRREENARVLVSRT